MLFPPHHGYPEQARLSIEGQSSILSKGMPCTQCTHSAKFWMPANTRTLATFWW